MGGNVWGVGFDWQINHDRHSLFEGDVSCREELGVVDVFWMILFMSFGRHRG